jgi:hypothetical protein
MREPISDVWKLETNDEDWASDNLNCIIACALDEDGLQGKAFTFGDRMNAIKYLRKLWDGESWESIKAKLQTEGSVWYVWYMDGVRTHLRNLLREVEQ